MVVDFNFLFKEEVAALCCTTATAFNCKQAGCLSIPLPTLPWPIGINSLHNVMIHSHTGTPPTPQNLSWEGLSSRLCASPGGICGGVLQAGKVRGLCPTSCSSAPHGDAGGAQLWGLEKDSSPQPLCLAQCSNGALLG